MSSVIFCYYRKGNNRVNGKFWGDYFVQSINKSIGKRGFLLLYFLTGVNCIALEQAKYSKHELAKLLQLTCWAGKRIRRGSRSVKRTKKVEIWKS